MKFGILYEVYPPGEFEVSEQDLFFQAIEQTVVAERAGFDYVWAVEHHFLEDFARCSAPEVFLGAVSQHTRTIRIAHGVAVLPMPFNHPIRVAERAATLDILSRGRLDLGTGRGTTLSEILGFDVDPDDAKPMWDESVKLLPRMWTEHEFSGHEGKYVKIPPRVIVPKPVQKPHPPIWKACTSPSSFEIAGRYGLGVLMNSFGTPEDLVPGIRAYEKGLECVEPIGHFVNRELAAFSVMHCGEDDRAARTRGGDASVEYLSKIGKYIGDIGLYKGYREWAEAHRHSPGERSHNRILDVMVNEGVLCLGDPQRCIDLMERYRQIGVTQFMAIVQVGSLTHEEIVDSLRLFGEKVIPKFRD